jgi:DNA helicase HerA-like ATPase
LLFDEAPKGLLEKVEQVVRLVRSKGVGIFFITQNPVDIPEEVAGQLGNRVQHALRAFTPKDERAIRAAADTFRRNPGVDVATAITELKTGEALVSVLDDKGAPTPVERTMIRPPRSRLGPLTGEERGIIRSTSSIGTKYDTAVDRESAEEILTSRAQKAAEAAALAQAAEDAAKAQVAAQREQARVDREARQNPGVIEGITRQFGRTVQRQVINRMAGQLVRGILGGLFRGR